MDQLLQNQALMVEVQPVTVILVFANHDILPTSTLVDVNTSDKKIKKMAIKHYRKNYPGMPDPKQLIITKAPALRVLTFSKSLHAHIKQPNQDQFTAMPELVLSLTQE